MSYNRARVDEFIVHLNEALNRHGDTPGQILLFLWMAESGLSASVDPTAFRVHHEALEVFHRLQSYEQANALYELSKHVESIVVGTARRYYVGAKNEERNGG